MLKTRKLLSKVLKRPISPKKRRKSGEITKLKKKLWQLCREITKNRYGRYCYTCHKFIEKGIHTGHFITSSTCSVAMRYSLENLRPQCYHCNINLSGNWVAFERILKVEGIDVQELKTQNDLGKGIVYPLSWFEEKIALYQKLATQTPIE